MKKSFYLSILILSLGIFWYCSSNDSQLQGTAKSEEQLQASNNDGRLLKNETVSSFEEFFDKIKIAGNNLDEEQDILFVDYQKNEDHSIQILGYEVIDFFTAGMFLFDDKIGEIDDLRKRALELKYTYTVVCKNKDGSTKWIETTTNPAKAVKLAKKCFDEGGCVNACRSLIIYAPYTKTFFITPFDSE